jgi:hypothetical protein
MRYTLSRAVRAEEVPAYASTFAFFVNVLPFTRISEAFLPVIGSRESILLDRDTLQI